MRKAVTCMRWQNIILYLGLISIPWFFLYPALSFEFASDDRVVIVENQYMRDPGNWWRMVSTDVFDRTIEGFSYNVVSLVGHWRPISKLSYLVDYTLWGPNSSRFHLTGILLHLATGCLLAYLCRLLGVSPLTAGLAALVFILHPVTARPIGLISLRADLWCGFFAVLSIVGAVRAEVDEDKSKTTWVLGSYLCVFLALLGKETGLCLPLLFTGFYLSRNKTKPQFLTRTFYQAWPYFAVVILYAFLRFVIFDIAIGKQNEFPPMGLWVLFISLSRLAFSYISELFAPTWVDHIWLPEILRGFPDWTVFLSWVGLLGVGLAAWKMWQKQNHNAFFGLLIMSLPILPLMKIDAISGEDVGELLPFEAHRLYISVMGFSVLFALLLEQTKSWVPLWKQRVIQGMLLVLIIIYASLFPAELGAYYDTESMVKRKLQNIDTFPPDKLPTSLQVTQLNQQALDLKVQKKYKEAEEALNKILQIQPYDAIALKNLAVLALIQKQPDQAITYLETVLNPVPHQSVDGTTRMTIGDQQMRHTSEVQRLLGQAYQMKEDYEKAREHFQLSLKIDPTDYETLLFLAWNAVARKDSAEAKKYLTEFLSNAPPTDSRYNFAVQKLRQIEGN